MEFECHTQVVKEVKRRDDHDKIQDREVVQRSLESGQADDVIDVEKFGKWTRSSNNGITCPFQTVRKREEVDIQWVKVVVSTGHHWCRRPNFFLWVTVPKQTVLHFLSYSLPTL